MRFVLIIIILLIGIIPYWTGIETERQFTDITQNIYESANLKLLKSNYQRGWFNSVASSVVKTDEQIFNLRHEINHGFMPISKISIHTIVESSNQLLLDISTKVKINGDNTSIVNMPPLEMAEYKLQGLQGHISANRQFTKIETVFNSPKLTDGLIEIQDISLQLNVKNAIADGNLKIANVVEQGIQLADIELFGNGQIHNNKLLLDVQTKIHKVGNYDSSSSNIKLSNWHLPSLSQIFLTKNKGMIWMAQGMKLLEHSPELAITDFELNTQEGLVHGNLQIKLEPLANPLLVLFNPNPLLNILNLQLEIHLPKSFLSTIPYESVRHQLEIWVEKGILVENSDYYQSYISVAKGLLLVNGKPSPLILQ